MIIASASAFQTSYLPSPRSKKEIVRRQGGISDVDFAADADADVDEGSCGRDMNVGDEGEREE